jgi:hypothetical protein
MDLKRLRTFVAEAELGMTMKKYHIADCELSIHGCAGE